MSWVLAPRGRDDSAAGKRLQALSNAVDATLSGERSWEDGLEQYRREVDRIKTETK